MSGTEYLLVAVKPRGSAYENLDRYAYRVNPVSGGIEFIDVVDTEDSGCPAPRRPLAQSASPPPAASPAPLFAAYSPSSCSSSASRSRCCR